MFKITGPTVVYPHKLFAEPATLKFGFYYMTQPRDKMKNTVKIRDLLDLSTNELKEVIAATGIKPDDICLNYDNCIYSLKKLRGYDIQ